MSGKESKKLYLSGEVVIVKRDGRVRECKVIEHFSKISDGLLYVEDTRTGGRFLISPSEVEKQKIYYIDEGSEREV